MKRIVLSVTTVVAMSSVTFAGGDFIPVVEPVMVIPPVPINTTGLYVGIGLVATYFDGVCSCGNSYEDYTYGALLRLGYDYNEYIGLEARVLTSQIEDEGAKIKSHYGVFLKPQYHITDDINVYGLLGYANTEVGDTIKIDDSGFSWGVGLEYDISDDKKEDGIYDRAFDGKGNQEKGLGLYIDYQKLLQKDNYPHDMHVLSVGLSYDF
ncbi:putative outer membrane protein A [hydrothermal vent metagenome]|uniref:Putative outer membrane protein A n=1 Tax=hydrothermal vent metagenome TaxID=652676 RepID=A0A1W1EKR3_9ZZZZ